MEELDPVELLLSRRRRLRAALHGAAPDAGAARGRRPRRSASPVTRIGRVEAGAGAVLSGGAGERDIADLGHDHLERRRDEPIPPLPTGGTTRKRRKSLQAAGGSSSCSS